MFVLIYGLNASAQSIFFIFMAIFYELKLISKINKKLNYCLLLTKTTLKTPYYIV